MKMDLIHIIMVTKRIQVASTTKVSIYVLRDVTISRPEPLRIVLEVILPHDFSVL
jgi:hypothetical protein